MVKDNQHGRSMVEVIGYMGAVMAIVAGVGKMVSGAYSDYKISKASQQLSDLASAIVRASTIDPNYTETVKKITDVNSDKHSDGLKLIPSTFRVAGSKIFHAFGGETTLGTVGNMFYIRYDNLTREQCIELGMKDWINNKIVDLAFLNVNGDDDWCWPANKGSENNCPTLPTKRSILAGANENDDNDNGQCNKETDNFIIWYFN